MRWLCILVLALGLAQASAPQNRTVRIGVLGIFHPTQITVAAVGNGELLLSVEGRRLFVRPRSSCSTAALRASGGLLILRCGGQELRTSQLHASGRNQQGTAFVLAIPGKIERRYDGILDLKAEDGEIVAVVTMQMEIAVGSIVQAETIPGTPLEALKAQAVVSRSYLVAARGRHTDFDFCDLTHCQFLREPPKASSLAAQATAVTQGLVLTYKGQPVAAMFTRSCGGNTRTPAEIGLSSAGYPYYSVRCEICYKDPVRWTHTLSREDAALLSAQGENGRIALGRKLGWDAAPSNNFTAQSQDTEVTLQGIGEGHGIGLCQRGARSMADLGSDFRSILRHYFPNTNVERFP